MYEIPKEMTRRWGALHNDGNVFVPNAIHIGCPHCKNSPVVFSMTNQWEKRADSLFKKSICPSCVQETYFWIIEYSGYPNAIDAKGKSRVFMFPSPPTSLQYDEDINGVSPQFSEIYRQTSQAEAEGLNNLVGIGYRKSLEFLIKDWLIQEYPNDKDKIAKSTISQCISLYIDDTNLKECAKRAIWLGNDETHYIRKWETKDINDMKKLLEITLYWLSAHLASKRLIEEMPEQ